MFPSISGKFLHHPVIRARPGPHKGEPAGCEVLRLGTWTTLGSVFSRSIAIFVPGMIKKETIEKVLDAARIDEVVGDFVDLKKRGTSLIGNCPFHNEKTPSFHVSVSKGIY